MEIKPVKSTKKPGYPTISRYIEHPQLLSKNIPVAWLKNKYVTTALASFIMYGCNNFSNTAKNQPSVEIIPDSLSGNRNQQQADAIHGMSVKVAPVFVHGEGRGVTGCVAISPPVFISEEEALNIIFEALEAEGIKIQSGNNPVIKFSAPAIADDCHFFDEEKTELPVAKVELEADGYNQENNLIIHYVSTWDFDKFRSEDDCRSSVQDYDTQKAAGLIRENLVKEGKNNAVVFYDPLISERRRTRVGEPEETTKVTSRDMLLAQVQDFIVWMKNEGLLNK